MAILKQFRIVYLKSKVGQRTAAQREMKVDAVDAMAALDIFTNRKVKGFIYNVLYWEDKTHG